MSNLKKSTSLDRFKDAKPEPIFRVNLRPMTPSIGLYSYGANTCNQKDTFLGRRSATQEQLVQQKDINT